MGAYPARIGGITPGTSYTATVYVNRDAAFGPITPRIEWFNASNSFLGITSGTAVSPPAGAWTQLQVSGVAPATADRATVTFYSYGTQNGATYYLDEGTLQTTGGGATAAAFGLIGAVAIGLIAAYRRRARQ
jgi:hypothetical protein